METDGRRRLGEILLKERLITRDELREALKIQRDTGASLGRIFMEMGVLSQSEVLRALSRQCRIAAVRLSDYSLQPEHLQLLTPSVIQRSLTIPLDKMGDLFTVAVPDPLDLLALREVFLETGLWVKPVICTPEDVREQMSLHYGLGVQSWERSHEIDQAFERILYHATAESRRPFEDKTFERFVAGEGNDFAYGAAKEISEEPAVMYNPLFIEGDSGLGKTHLLHAIANRLWARNPSSCLWTRASALDREEVEAWLLDAGRPCVLMIDSAEESLGDAIRAEKFLLDLERLAVHEGVHLIVAGRIGPATDERIATFWQDRFGTGVSIRLETPDETTRLAFLERLASEESAPLDESCLQLIAERVQGGGGALEKAWSLMRAYSCVSGQDVTLELCEELLEQSHPTSLEGAARLEGTVLGGESDVWRLLSLAGRAASAMMAKSSLARSSAFQIAQDMDRVVGLLQKDLVAAHRISRELGWLCAWKALQTDEWAARPVQSASKSDSDAEAIPVETEEPAEDPSPQWTHPGDAVEEVVDLHDEPSDVEEPSDEWNPPITEDTSDTRVMESPQSEPVTEESDSGPVVASPETHEAMEIVVDLHEEKPDVSQQERPASPEPEDLVSVSESPEISTFSGESTPSEAPPVVEPQAEVPIPIEVERTAELQEETDAGRRGDVQKVRLAARKAREKRIAQALASEVRRSLLELSQMVLTDGEKAMLPEIEKLLTLVEADQDRLERSTLLETAERAKTEILHFSERIMERLQFEDAVRRRQAAIGRGLQDMVLEGTDVEVPDLVEAVKSSLVEADQLLQGGMYAGAAELLEKALSDTETARLEGRKRLQKRLMMEQTEQVSGMLDQVEKRLLELEEEGAAQHVPDALKSVYKLFTDATRSLRRENVSEARAKAEEASVEVERLKVELLKYLEEYRMRVLKILQDGRDLVGEVEDRRAIHLVEVDAAELNARFDICQKLLDGGHLKEAERLSIEATGDAITLRDDAMKRLGIQSEAERLLSETEVVMDRLRDETVFSVLDGHYSKAIETLEIARSQLSTMEFEKARETSQQALEEAKEVSRLQEEIRIKIERYVSGLEELDRSKAQSEALDAASRAPDLLQSALRLSESLVRTPDPGTVDRQLMDLEETRTSFGAVIEVAGQKRNQELSQRVSALRNEIGGQWDQVAHFVRKVSEESLKVEVKELLEQCDNAEGLGELDKALEAVEGAHEAMQELFEMVEGRRKAEREQLEIVYSRSMSVYALFETEETLSYSEGKAEALANKLREGWDKWEKEGAFEQAFVLLRQVEDEIGGVLESSRTRKTDVERKRRVAEVSARLDELDMAAHQLEEQNVLVYLPMLYRTVCQCIKGASQAIMEEDMANAIPAMEKAEALIREMQDNLEQEQKKEEEGAQELLAKAISSVEELRRSDFDKAFPQEFKEIEDILSEVHMAFEDENWRQCESSCITVTERCITVQRKGGKYLDRNKRLMAQLTDLGVEVASIEGAGLMAMGPEKVEAIKARIAEARTVLGTVSGEDHEQELQRVTAEVEVFKSEFQSALEALKQRAREEKNKTEETLDALKERSGIFHSDTRDRLLSAQRLLDEEEYMKAIEAYALIREDILAYVDKVEKESVAAEEAARAAVEEDLSQELTGIRGILMKVKKALTREEEAGRAEVESQLSGLKRRVRALASANEQGEDVSLAEKVEGAEELLKRIEKGLNAGELAGELLSALEDVEQSVVDLENRRMLKEEIDQVAQEIQGLADLQEKKRPSEEHRDAVLLATNLRDSALQAFGHEDWETAWTSLRQAREVLTELKASAQDTEVGEAYPVENEGEAAAMLERFGIRFMAAPQFALDTFRPGTQNEYILAALKEIVRVPGQTGNPCIVVGDRGTGKTHLLHGLANGLVEADMLSKVICMPALEFGKGFLEALQRGSGDELRSELQRVDALLLDDIIELGDIDAIVQDNLVRLIVSLSEQQRQVVFTSAGNPKDSRRLKQEFRHCLEESVILELKPLDSEARLKLLRDQCKEWKASLSEDVLEQLAANLGNNIASYGDAIQRLLSHSYLSGQQPSKKLVKKICKEMASGR